MGFPAEVRVFAEYMEAVHGVAPRLTSCPELCYLSSVSGPDDVTRALARPPETLRLAEMRGLFEAGFHVWLWYVPLLYEGLYRRDRDCCEMIPQAVCSPTGYCEELSDIGLLEGTMRCIRMVFWEWVSRFRIEGPPAVGGVPHEFPVSFWVLGGEDRDEYAYCLVDAWSVPGVFPLCEEVLRSWGRLPTAPERSAHLLDFCASVQSEHWRCVYPELAGHALVQQMIEDVDLLKGHERNCRALWHRLRVPRAYSEAVLRMLHLS